MRVLPFTVLKSSDTKPRPVLIAALRLQRPSKMTSALGLRYSGARAARLCALGNAAAKLEL